MGNQEKQSAVSIQHSALRHLHGDGFIWWFSSSCFHPVKDIRESTILVRG
jgi:hypothetical protein